MSKNFSAVAITTGDKDGIGFEVAAKALATLKPQKNICFFVFRDHQHEAIQPALFKKIDSRFTRLTFSTLKASQAFYLILKQTNALDKNFIFDLALKSDAASWVIDATVLCREGFFKSLVTAPISKTLIQKSGYNFVGHTGIFRHFFPQNDLFMAFVGKHFNVVLATDHVSLSSVEKLLTPSVLTSSVDACLNLSRLLKTKKPIGLLGLNPHAGEKGVVGSFEEKLLSRTTKKFGKKISGPLSPDAAFLKSNWPNYSSYLALYHDQGLIPFKMVHGQDSGVHLTLGLPFVRTSVDHGTAKNIFNKNIANPNSMIDAIKLNLKLIST